jgi:hypothetical protein
MTTTNSHLTAFALAATLAACGSSLPPRSAALDPANPDAPESPLVTGTADTDAKGGMPEPAESGHEAAQHAGHNHGGASAEPPGTSQAAQSPAPAGAVIYTCPMHPEVTSPAPGRCPKCGMKLVPRKDEK